MIRNVKVKAWSYSRLSEYELCPAKAGYRAKGLKEPPSPTLVEGQRVHGLGEDYVAGNLKRVPAEYENFAKEMREMRKLGYTPEDMWCMDRQWEEAPSYGEPGHWELTWCRVKVDAFGFPEDGVLDIVDYKTGRVNEEKDSDQMHLYGTSGLALFDADVVRTRLWYLDVGVEFKREYEQSETNLRDMVAYWEDRVDRFFKEKRWDPKPGHYCTWCHYSKEKGGPCKY